MADRLTPAHRSRNMAAIRNKNTKPELLVRQMLHALGFRFRLHAKQLPGRPDIYLAKWKLAVFVNGCFWHGHDECPLYRLPKTRQEFWAGKVATNIARDIAVREKLLTMGLRYLDIWECAIKGKAAINNDEFVAELIAVVRGTQTQSDIRGSRIVVHGENVVLDNL